MTLLKIIIGLSLILTNGYKVEYNHVPTAKSGYLAVYNSGGDCIADDIQPQDLYTVAIEEGL